jgi:signal transduction histidine kinase
MGNLHHGLGVKRYAVKISKDMCCSTGHFHHGLSPALSGNRKQPRAIPAELTFPDNQRQHSDSYGRAFGNFVAELESARESERQKIANQLHDQIGQNLILAMMKLRALETSLSEKEGVRIREVHELIREVLDETRSLMCDLYPHALRDLGLQAAVEWLVERTRVNHGLDCVAELVSVPQALPPDTADTVFQAVRELLNNAAKHARAKQIRVVFHASGRRMFIQIIDDGKGFEPDRVSSVDPRHGGFGLFSIRERLSRVGASMHIDSRPGNGTKVTMMFPIKAEKAA